jgi:AbrB family looped-hinge helix DNA binding protein
MELSLDKLGRVVIPKSVRDHYHLQPGSRLRLHESDDGLHLQPVLDEPAVREQAGVLIISADSGTRLTASEVERVIIREREHRLPS